jgi:cell division protein ZapA
VSTQIKPVSVTILDKEYRIACKPGEEDDVAASARHLDGRMREIRKGGKVLGTERIAVMAALNLAHELISQASALQETSDTTGQRLRALTQKVENAVQEANQLEF